MLYSDGVAFRGMRSSMGWQGAGRRFTTLIGKRAMRIPGNDIRSDIGNDMRNVMGRVMGTAIGTALLALALGCSESEAGAAPARVDVAVATPGSTTASEPGARPAAPERVVQRLSPSADGNAEIERRESAASASAATARGSEPSVSDTTITPHHLEAELNRLEAELAN